MPEETLKVRIVIDGDEADGRIDALLDRLGGGSGGFNVPGSRPPAGGGDGGGGQVPGRGGAGGVDPTMLRQFAELGAGIVSMREVLRQLGNAVTAFTDAANRTALRRAGLTEGGLANVRAAQGAAAATIDQLGPAGAFASPAQINSLYQANRQLEMMKALGRAAVERISDPEIMSQSAPFAAAALAAGIAAKVGIPMPRMLHR